jgi:putative ABC transport system permease protein
MGRILLVGRLAGRDLRRRPVEAALLLVAITAATATLTLGLILHDVVSDPYQRTREATAGPDVVASVSPDLFEGKPATLDGLQKLIEAPGVVGHSGPYPVTGAVLNAEGQLATAQLEGRDTAPAAINQPKLTQGGWVADGGVVVEAAFAKALGVGEGDRITLNGRSFHVVGVAVTAAAPPYPSMTIGGTIDNPLQYCPLPSPSPCDQPLVDGQPNPELEPGAPAMRRIDSEHPGLVWLTQADARGLAANAASLNYVVNLKLDDPANASAFVTARTGGFGPWIGGSTDGAALQSWQQIRHQIEADLERNEQEVLLIGSRLLALLAVASVAVLVGGRMADQTRRVGLLKAVGGTPRLVAAVLLAEYVVVALLAAAAGLAAGWLAAPLLTDPGAGLLGSAGAPSLTLSTVGVVTAVALGVAVAATFVPAIRAARASTVRALADAARAPRRLAWLVAISARLPVPLLFGLRMAARRPRRVILGVVSIAITVSGVVAAMAVDAQIGEDRGSSLKAEQGHQVLLVISITLLALAAVNAIFITWATVLDNKHSSALARALGATPRQVSAGLSAAQVLPALAGAALGIPGGIALLKTTAGDADSIPAPSLGLLLAVVAGTALAVAVLTAIPARLGGRRPAAETLQAEFA